jgi:hypothetical protein
MNARILAAGLYFIVSLFSAEAQTLQVPPYPQNLDLSPVERLYKSAAYKVEVRRSGTADAYTECFVFETRNDWVLYDFFGTDPNVVLRSATQYGNGKADARTASFAQFSFANTAVDVRLTLLGSTAVANTVTIRPLRHQISPTVSPDQKVITFSLASPRKISIDINDRLNPLFLFADAPDVPDTTATYYYGPGLHRIAGGGTLTLNSNQRVYVAAGAIVEGRFKLAAGSSHITIRGRGIVSNGEWPHPTPNAYADLKPLATVWSDYTHDFLLEGVTFVQSSAWQIAIEDYSPGGNGTYDNFYSNVKLVSWAGNTDSFWVTGQNNRVDDCFTFNNDDIVVSKGGGGAVVTNLVAWSGVWGRLTLFHLITGGRPNVNSYTMENVDVIAKEGQPQLIHVSGGTSGRFINNATFRDIRIEERRRPGNTNNSTYNAVRLIQLGTGINPGPVTNLRLENFSLPQKLPDEGYLQGSSTYPYNNITFKNLTMGGELILSEAASNIDINDNVSNVQWLPPDPPLASGIVLLGSIATGGAATSESLGSGANLISNSGFETGTTANWGSTGSSTKTVVTTDPHSGTYCLSIAPPSNGGVGRTISGLLPNTTYRLSAWGRLASGTTGGTILANSFGGSNLTANFTSTSWQQASITFATGAASTSAYIGTYNTQAIFVDDFELVRLSGDFEVGTKFRSTTAGQVTALRVWHPAGGPGSYNLTLWNTAGTSLATATVTAGTAAEWLEAPLLTPVLIAADTIHTVSYQVPAGAFYQATLGGLASPVRSGSLETVAGNNGVYATAAGTFPALSAGDTNYWADVRVATALTTWRDSKFGTSSTANPALEATLWGDLADPDSDGYLNLLEYSFDTNPNVPGVAGMPTVSRDPQGHLVITFLRARADLIYRVQGAGEDFNWELIASNPGSVGQSISVTDTASVDAPKRFLRLQIISP